MAELYITPIKMNEKILGKLNLKDNKRKHELEVNETNTTTDNSLFLCYLHFAFSRVNWGKEKKKKKKPE